MQKVFDVSRKSIKEAWEVFREAQLPANTSSRVVNAMKYSFYVGSCIMYFHLMNANEEEVAKINEEIETIIMEFNEESLKNSVEVNGRPN